MDRLHAMNVFVAVAELGSFAEAGRRLRLSPPAVTRAISFLEDRLDVRLFNRTTRSLSLTDEGARYLKTTRQVLTDIEEGEQAAAGTHGEPSGHLSLTSSVTFARLHMVPVVSEFMAIYPKITTSLICLDRVVNLIEDGLDVAIRIAHLDDSTMLARACGSVRRMLVASPKYLKSNGHPQSPADLKDHHLIAFTGLSPNREWRLTKDGKTHTVRLAPRLEINDPTAAISAAELGQGITQVLDYMVADALKRKKLVPVLDEFCRPTSPVQLVFMGRRSLPAKTRAFIDFAAPRIAARLHS